MLHAFKAVHDYKVDEVQVLGVGGTRMLQNQSQRKKMSIKEVEELEETHIVAKEEQKREQTIVEETPNTTEQTDTRKRNRTSAERSTHRLLSQRRSNIHKTHPSTQP
jgi:hypothetical protein